MKAARTVVALLATTVSVALITLAFVSCGQTGSNAAGLSTVGSTNVGVGGVSCTTPNEGCPCSNPGQVVECGKVSHVGPGGYVACQMGHRTCVGPDWGACVGDYDVVTTKNLVAAGGLHPLSLGPSQVCPTDGGPYSNVCDPYCNYFLDTPEGGVEGGTGIVVINDAGAITIDPTADGGVTGGGGFSAPQAGVSGCSPNRNIVGPSCTAANALTTCQQDFRCDPTTLTCLWNGNTAYSNPSAGGVDLTLESPCGPQGSANSSVVVCNRGSATLAAGASITFFVSTGSSAPNSCTNLGAPTQTNVLASALAPGQCTSFTLGNSTGAKFITINAGLPGGPGAPAVTEAPGHCANNSAYWRTDGSGGTCALCNSCVTTLTGTIYDPAGSNVLPDVTVYVPTAKPSALPTVAACDTCTSLITGTPWSIATTDYKGNFSITVRDTDTFPLVIQAGRWRRQLTISGITPCSTVSLDSFCKANTCQGYNPVAGTYSQCAGTGIAAPLDIGATSGGKATCSRLPGISTEGDMPTMALVQAAGDQLECLMRKVGVADSEFTKAGGGGKISLFSHNGMTWAGESADSALWGNSATGASPTFSSYAAVIAPCDNNHTTYVSSVTGPSTNVANAPNPSATAPQAANMAAYLNAGGRLFTTHWFAFDWLQTAYPTAFTNVFGTAVDNDREAPQFDFTIDQTTSTGLLYANWLNYVGASPGGFGTVRFLSWRHLPQSVNTPGTLRLAYGDSSKAPVSHSPPGAGPLVAAYQFDTPYGSASPCGRVDVAMSHVSAYGSGAFPGGCGWATGAAAPAMSAQEQAFEFLIFNSQKCLGLVPTVPPPSTPALPTVTFTRDYQGVCPSGTMVKWGVFYWEATIPGASNIQFSAATADTQASLPAAAGVQPTSTSRVIGNATTTSTAPAWDCGGCPSAPVTVDYHLKNDTPAPNTPSKAWVRVFMTFTPDNSMNPPVSPTLTAWRQTYDCVPSE
ncbi:MAG: hypothetical protein ACRENE_15515 [Polyangiaceae bacterium]